MWLAQLHRRSLGCLLLATLSGCQTNEVKTMSPEVERLFQSANDSDLCNEVFEKIGDRYEHVISADEYTDEERVVMLVWHANGIVRNGGFEYLFDGYFPGDLDFQLTARAFEQIDCPQAAAMFRKALSLFPNGRIPSNINERWDAYTATDEAERERINETFWRTDDDEGGEWTLRHKLAEYIRKHKDAFGHL